MSNKTTTIGIDVSQAQYQGSGVATYTVNIVKHLLNLESQYSFILFGASMRGYSQLGQIFSDLTATKRFFPFNPLIMDYLFNRTQFPIDALLPQAKLFHASDWTHPHSLSKKMVTTIHDLTILKYPEHHANEVVETHKRRLERVVASRAHILSDSDATKQDIVTLLKVNPDLITTVHLAAGTEFSDFARANRQERTELVQRVKQKYGLTQYILSVGTREPRKNMDRTIQAFEQLSQSHVRQTQMVIAGKYGWGKDEVQLHPSVKVLGYVPQADLPALYAGAQAFVYPSLYEGFGLPVLEAMTVGVPVVTSNKGSLAEVAGNGGVIVNPYSVKAISNGIVEAISKRQEYRQKGINQAKNFNWEKAAEQTLSVYQQVLAHHD